MSVSGHPWGTGKPAVESSWHPQGTRDPAALGAASRKLARRPDIGLRQESKLKKNTAEKCALCILIILISPKYSDHGTFVYALFVLDQEPTLFFACT